MVSINTDIINFFERTDKLSALVMKGSRDDIEGTHRSILFDAGKEANGAKSNEA